MRGWNGWSVNYRFQPHLETVAMEPPLVVASVDDLREAVVLACQASYVPRILRGRAGILSGAEGVGPRHVEQIAEDAIDWDDEWDYL